MKAKELMIGDWVCVTKNFTQKYHKIRALSNDEGAVLRGIYVNEYGVKSHSIFSPNDTEPIPLTPEILEKNGFKKVQIHGEKQDDIFQCFDGEIIIEVGIYDPNFILIHYRYETPGGINSGELSSIVKVDGGKFYLHELQHALKLCGIEKEIEL